MNIFLLGFIDNAVNKKLKLKKVHKMLLFFFFNVNMKMKRLLTKKL